MTETTRMSCIVHVTNYESYATYQLTTLIGNDNHHNGLQKKKTCK